MALMFIGGRFLLGTASMSFMTTSFAWNTSRHAGTRLNFASKSSDPPVDCQV